MKTSLPRFWRGALALAICLTTTKPASADEASWVDTAVRVATKETGQSDKRARYVAKAVWKMAEDEEQAAWMMAHAIVESDLRVEVETCKVVGKLGEKGLWQVNGGPTARCPSLIEQARWARYRLGIAKRAGRDLARVWGGLRPERRIALARQMGAK